MKNLILILSLLAVVAFSSCEKTEIYYITNGDTTQVNIIPDTSFSSYRDFPLIVDCDFDGNTNDSSGFSNDPLILNAVPCQDRFGNDNSAYYFDGYSYMRCGFNNSHPAQSNSSMISTNYTIQYWLKLESTGTIAQLASDDRYIGGNSYNFYTDNASKITFRYWNYGNFTEISTNLVGVWCQVTAVVDAGHNKCKLYINGVYTCETNVQELTGNRSLFLGMNANGTNSCQMSIDDVRLYSCTLTSYEILRIYNDDK